MKDAAARLRVNRMAGLWGNKDARLGTKAEMSGSKSPPPPLSHALTKRFLGWYSAIPKYFFKYSVCSNQSIGSPHWKYFMLRFILYSSPFLGVPRF